MTSRNLTLLMDFYELTMANGFFENKMKNRVSYFDMFFRKIPDGGGYAIMAGLEPLIRELEAFKFTDGDLEFLKGKNIFSGEFLNYLRNFKLSCDIWAVPEGTPIFPGEPIVTVRGNVIEAQLIETLLLLTINHQSLIATKASRIVRAARGKPVIELGSRRAQGFDGAIYGARAAFIGGCIGTSCTIAEKELGVPAYGTMAHSWVQSFPTELEAFRAYAGIYPSSCILLVDTYNVLKSGVPNAIAVFKELHKQNFKPAGIRIDSGDITYLSKKSRKMLDSAGFPDCKIIASNSLDEYIIRDLILQGAEIDCFGVGERLITSKSEPVFGGVYKLSAMEENSAVVPKIKLSENPQKISNPGHKELWRIYDRNSGMAEADVITLAGEIIDESSPYTIFSPVHTYKRKTFKDFRAVKLQKEIFRGGICVYKSPPLFEIKSYCKGQIDVLWEEIKRFENPHEYYVDLSQKLYDVKKELLKKYFQ